MPRPARAAFSLTIALLLLAGCGADEPRAGLVPALGGALFTAPVEVGAYPGDRVFVAERGGHIWLADAGDQGGEPVLLGDLGPIVEARLGEGLLSVALGPRFEETRHLWAYYFAAEEPWRTVLARFDVGDGGLDLATELVVLELEQPGFNQNGGAIRFDADGYLYLSVGDGSASTDPFEQGQDTTTLLATVLRLDVRNASEAQPYAVPEDNPFVGRPDVRAEIYAFGFRNPWRMSIDHPSGAIWLGDVGFSNAEEVNRVQAGGNYGWSILEGARCLDARDCDAAALDPPVHQWAHEEGRCAAVGGLVYRGSAIEDLAGRYLFGDLCSGEIWALRGDIEPDGTAAAVEPLLLADLDGMLVTFGVDGNGEVLVADHRGGGIYRLVPE
ncbi:MAG: sorbosone dehydrogenase family protein [Dehalococcoidia bacterium]